MAGQRGRRGNGEGSISFVHGKDGAPDRWMARLTLANGRRKAIYARTRQEAAQKLTAALRDRDTGLPVVAEKQTVAAFLASWLDIVKPRIEPKTHERYSEQVRLHLVPGLGKHRLAKLSAQQVQQFYAAKLGEGLAPATVHHMHVTLNGALETALKLGAVPRNVCTLVTPPQPVAREMHALDAEQVRTLFAAARGERLEALYVVAVMTGARLGELCALRWADVELDAASGPVLHIRHTLHYEKGVTWRLAPPKTKASRRRIELSPTAVNALRQHRARQLAERLQLGGDIWQDHGFVFCRPDGRPLRREIVYQSGLLPLLKRAGLPVIRFHDLRHTAATLLLTNGVFVKQVSEMLGHANVAITMTVYAHVLPTMHRDAATAMERLVGVS